MNSHESRIEPTTFGTLATELGCPFSDYDYLIHVHERSMLASLAEQLEPVAAQGGIEPVSLVALLADHLKDGAVRLSSWRPLDVLEPRQFIAVEAVPRRARCDTLSLPPCYLVHTPGLFEGTLATVRVLREPSEHEHAHRLRALKL
jgi:hypothetical protein